MQSINRKKIGLLFISDDIGVIYYLINIIHALSSLKEDEMPEIIIFYNSICQDYLKQIKYPHLLLKSIEFSSQNRIKYYIKSFLLRKNFYYEEVVNSYNVDAIFPFNNFPVKQKKIDTKLVSWIPDFQHKFYPHFFTIKNLFLRERRFKTIIKNTHALVLSSFDAMNHLKKYYAVPSKTDIHILQFVSMIKDHTIEQFSEVNKKLELFNIPYFLVSNQFYEHKNHMVVLKAIKILKQEGIEFKVIFTGKTTDYRNPKFYASLLRWIEENNIESNVKILGLISREEQLSLLINSLAVIQPSKFEGWSTIIEDAKTLKHQIICSDIAVHFEQLGENGFYFSKDSETKLADLMKQFIFGVVEKKIMPDDYKTRVYKFAKSFCEIVK